ncbi:MAG: hypothetical protein JXQ90_00070 [Cyclobacteriaceae bacterium]
MFEIESEELPNSEEILKEELDKVKDDLHLLHQDMQRIRHREQLLISFIQDIHSACEELNLDDYSLQQVLSNLKLNIEQFSKDNYIKLK